MPSIGPHNPALGEIYQRLYPEMRRPKPNQEAIAAALQAMQRLTMEADSETVSDATQETIVNASTAWCTHMPPPVSTRAPASNCLRISTFC